MITDVRGQKTGDRGQKIKRDGEVLNGGKLEKTKVGRCFEVGSVNAEVGKDEGKKVGG